MEDSRRTPKIQLWQLENIVNDYAQEINTALQRDICAENVSSIYLRSTSRLIKELRREYLNRSRELSSRYIEKGSNHEAQ